MDPVESRYGLTIQATNSITIGFYPDKDGSCDFGSCTSTGYYRAVVKHEGREDVFDHWFCGDHVKHLLDQLVNETELRRQIS